MFQDIGSAERIGSKVSVYSLKIKDLQAIKNWKTHLITDDFARVKNSFEFKCIREPSAK